MRPFAYTKHPSLTISTSTCTLLCFSQCVGQARQGVLHTFLATLSKTPPTVECRGLFQRRASKCPFSFRPNLRLIPMLILMATSNYDLRIVLSVGELIEADFIFVNYGRKDWERFLLERE